MEDLIVEIGNGKVLLNPKMKIKNVSEYNVVTNDYTVEISFRENGGLYDHNRFYNFTNDKLGGLEFTDVITRVKEHPVIGVVPLILNDGTEI